MFKKNVFQTIKSVRAAIASMVATTTAATAATFPRVCRKNTAEKIRIKKANLLEDEENDA